MRSPQCSESAGCSQGLHLTHGQHAVDLIRLESQHLWSAGAGQHNHVAQLLDNSLYPQPVHGVPGLQMNDLETAAG